MAKARTSAQKAALRKAQLASARKRRGRGRRRSAIRGVMAVAVVAGGAVAYSKNRKVVNRTVKRHAHKAKPPLKFVAGMVKSPAGAVVHAQAAVAALRGSKHGRNFIESSINWHQMERANPGKRMYSVG